MIATATATPPTPRKAPVRRKITADPLRDIEAELDAELKKLRMSKLAIGRLLVKARPLVPYGEWLPWVEARGLSMRTAQNYIRLAECENFSHLPDGADPTYREAGMLADLTMPEAEAPKAKPKPKPEKVIGGSLVVWFRQCQKWGIPTTPEAVEKLKITDIYKTATAITLLLEYLKKLGERLEQLSLDDAN